MAQPPSRPKDDQPEPEPPTPDDVSTGDRLAVRVWLLCVLAIVAVGVCTYLIGCFAM
jgi:hypothetical protein